MIRLLVTSLTINRISRSELVRVQGGVTHRTALSACLRHERKGCVRVTVKQELYLYANITSESTPVCVFSTVVASLCGNSVPPVLIVQLRLVQHICVAAIAALDFTYNTTQ